MKEVAQVAEKKIFVGLSGGVDSAVTAALLKERGANVTGVFIKGWYPPGMPCTWASDRRDAMRVAARIGIPFYTLDAQKEYKKGVIDYLLAEYAAGRTPNPDIMCNREVKFGAFYTFAMEKGADFIATGHYAQVEHNEGETSRLIRGVDESKDQSYFLWAIPPEALARTLFPLGELHKPDVRKLAEKYNLPVATKKDSQGICFLGSISVDDFLRKELAPEQGKAIDEDGVEIGTHDGAVLHTLGERVALSHAAPGPWYVVKKDMRENVITVSHTIIQNSDHKEITLQQTNWFTPANQVDRDTPIEAQYRYHGPRIKGSLSNNNTLFTPSSAFIDSVAPGQSLVLYQNEICIGGGIIA